MKNWSCSVNDFIHGVYAIFVTVIICLLGIDVISYQWEAYDAALKRMESVNAALVEAGFARYDDGAALAMNSTPEPPGIQWMEPEEFDLAWQNKGKERIK
jgi:hypothetical protein